MNGTLVPRTILIENQAITAATGVRLRLLERPFSNGELCSVVVQKLAGAATDVDIIIRYTETSANEIDQVYVVSGGAFSGNAFYDVLDPAQIFDGNKRDGLWIFVQPDADGTFSIRIDTKILSK